MNNGSLKALLARPGLIVAPGAYDCMTAKLVQEQGFGAVYMTGSGTSFSRYGFADVGLTTLTEMVDNATAISRSVSIPVIADADTGYGNAINVRRTVREYERAGISALHLEDQTFPKRCGHFDSKSVIPTEEMCQKIRAAVDARESDELLIIARTDAIAVNGFDDALDRARRFADAGADILFVEAPTSIAEIEKIPQAISTPLLFNMAEGKTPFMKAADLEQLGYRIMIVPSTHRVVVPAVRAYLQHLAETGDYQSYSDRFLPWKDWMELVGLPEIKDLEARYAVSGD